MRTVAIALAFCFSGGCFAAKAAPSVEGTPVSAASRPYRVELLLAIDPSPKIPQPSIGDLLHDLKKDVARVLGDCWNVDVRIAPAESLRRLPAPEAVSSDAAAPIDKIILVRLECRPDDPAPKATAFEYDATLRSWGPGVSELVRSDRDLSMRIVKLALRAFRPTATIVGKENRVAKLDIRGSALIPATSDARLLAAGDPLSIVRVWEDDGARTEVVPWSFLVVREDGTKGRRFGGQADIQSLFRDPLTRRSRQKVRLEAIACRVGDDPSTTIEFRTRPEDRPIVGYAVAARPDGQAGYVSLGSTDYSGRVEVSLADIAAGRARSARVVDVLLMSGDLILARFPMVPGDRPTLLAQTNIDPLLPELAGQVIAFQEGVVDLAARRKILELRLKKASSESNIEKIKQLAETINNLPDREQMAARLTVLEDRASSRSRELGQKSLGPNLRRLFLQTQALVERSVPQEKYQIQVQAVEVPADKPQPAQAAP